MKPSVIAISMGDPGGIGPEVTLKALRHLRKKERSPNSPRAKRFVLIGSLSLLEFANQKFQTGLRFRPLLLGRFDQDEDFSEKEIPVFDITGSEHFLQKIKFWDRSHRHGRSLQFAIGQVSPANGLLAIESVMWGVDLCLRGLADALVTAPLNKAAVRHVIPSFTGHTEFLKERTGAKRVAMMFIAGKFKMTLATMHVSLRDVSRSLNSNLIQEKIEMTHEALKKLFGIRSPKIGVAALNPHGSEFGREEERIIAPAIRRSKKRVPHVAGPIPGDEIFREVMEGKWDAIVAMYHDQGLAPFKMVAFREGVNMTLGLPFVRTSPDHGTAFDIAYRNKADFRPILSAIELAIKLAGKS